MKWTMTDTGGTGAGSIPNHRLSRRNTDRFIRALLYYSLKKTKQDISRNKLADKLGALTETARNAIKSHQVERIRNSITKKELSAIQMQLSDGDGDRPIHIAVASENLKLVHKLCSVMLKRKIPLDITNYLRQTPLHLAVILGSVELIELLLRFGASPVVCDRNGNSVLHLAVKSHTNKDVLQLLLSRDGVRNIMNSMDYEGYTALHYAVFKNNMGAVSVLQAFGADMNKIDGKSGRTALIHAVLEQNVNMVDLLLNCGACPQKTDYSGRSSLDMALQIENTEFVILLEKRVPHYEVTTVKIQVKPTRQLISKARRTKNQRPKTYQTY